MTIIFISLLNEVLVSGVVAGARYEFKFAGDGFL